MKIIIPCPEHDFTPSGKRGARVVQCTRGQQLRWYVGGRIFRWLAPTPENLDMTQEWLVGHPTLENGK